MRSKFLIGNRKGSDKIISVYWFAVLFIVAAAIVYMVVSFYGKPYDVREAEANALVNRAADCFSTGGYLNPSVLSDTFNENFLANCRLIFETEDSCGWNEQGQYYLNVSLTNFSNGKGLSSFADGNLNLKDYCGQKGDNLPVCVERSFYAIDENNGQYKINVLAVVRKTEKNVKSASCG